MVLAEQKLEKNKELTMLIYVLYGISVFLYFPFLLRL